MLASAVEGLDTGHVTAPKHREAIVGAEGGRHLLEGAGVLTPARQGGHPLREEDPVRHRGGDRPLREDPARQGGGGRPLREEGRARGLRHREGAGGPLPQGGNGLHLRQASVLVRGRRARTSGPPPNHRRGRGRSPVLVRRPLSVRMDPPVVATRRSSRRTEKLLPPPKTEKTTNDSSRMDRIEY